MRISDWSSDVCSSDLTGTDTGVLDAVPGVLTVDLGDLSDPTQVPITGTTTDVPAGATVAITVTDQNGNEVETTATVQPDGSYSVNADLSGLELGRASCRETVCLYV